MEEWPMDAIRMEIDCVVLLTPKVFVDERGFFFEAFNQREFNKVIGADILFVQDNQSKSRANVLRGLHYQVQKPQGKLVRVIAGEVFDVVVDIRKNSPSLGKHIAVRLSGENKQMLWIPPGFAHGFLVLSDQAEVLYKTTDYWAPEHERTILWNDPDLAIPWPVSGRPILSDKDIRGKNFVDMESL